MQFIWLVSPTAKSKAHDAHEKALPKSKSSGHGEAPVPAPSVESATEAPSSESTEVYPTRHLAMNLPV